MLARMIQLLPSTLRRRAEFAWRYLRGRTPWDTNQTPPELVEFVQTWPGAPGRALDLGCGTGTNVLFLARHGWAAVGVDYVPQAIARARRKADQAGIEVPFHLGDVTRLDSLPLEPPFDLLLDLGCLHSLSAEERQRYGAQVARLSAPGGWFLLYACLPRERRPGEWMGLTPDEVTACLAPAFRIERQEMGEDLTRGWGSGWYWLRRL